MKSSCVTMSWRAGPAVAQAAIGVARWPRLGMCDMGIRVDDIGNRLRAYRIGKGLAAEQVAEMLGVSRAAVYRIEAGEVIKIETLEPADRRS